MNVTNGFEYYQILYMLQNMLVLVRNTGQLEIKKSEAEATVNRNPPSIFEGISELYLLQTFMSPSHNV